MSTVTSSLIGRIVDDRYRVERLLARGGMASVFAATDLRLDRSVALKVMRPDLAADDAFVRRFRREARSAAGLSHPHVVGVFDQGEDDGLVFLAMELIEGRTLRDLIAQEAPLSVREAVALIDPVLAALQAAHDARVVHRDIKPENVLLGPGGVVKVADFGLARAIGVGNATSRSNDHTWGTAAYLAPEQVEHGQADARSDVYAAALVLYELLTGSKAFPGESPLQVAYQHVHGQLPRAADLVPSVPAEVDALIQRAGATDPAERPADAGQLRSALQEAISQLSEEELGPVPHGAARPGVPGTAEDDDPLGDWSDWGDAGDAAAHIPDAAPEHTAPIRPDATQRVPISAPPALGHYARTTGNRPVRPKRDRTDPIPIGRGSGAPRGVGPGPRRRRRTLPWVLGVLLAVISVGGAGAAWYYTVGPGVHSEVPAVTGRSAEQARSAIEALSLRVVLVQEYSETIGADQVIGQEPGAGTSLRHGAEVRVTVSQGPERYEVPAVLGRTEADARRLIEDANLGWANPATSHDPEVPVGQVISVTPEVGSPQPPESTIRVTISLGPEPIDVPSVIGVAEADARATLEQADLGVDVLPDAIYHADVPAGHVAIQSPADGTLLPSETVTLTLSAGPEPVEVPSVFGWSYTRAVEELEELGFVVDREDVAGGLLGLVRDQSVEAGSMLTPGSVIVLSVV